MHRSTSEVDADGTHGSRSRFDADRRRDARLLTEKGIAVLLPEKGIAVLLPDPRPD